MDPHDPKGRQAKSRHASRHMKNFWDRDAVSRSENLKYIFHPGPVLATWFINAESLSKAYGDKLLMENVSFTLPPGGIVGVIGPNGAGKTTLFKMITGEVSPDSGVLRLGETVESRACRTKPGCPRS